MNVKYGFQIDPEVLDQFLRYNTILVKRGLQYLSNSKG